MSTGPVTPLPQEPLVHEKRDMFGQRARSPTSWAIRSVPRVFVEGSFISGGGARTEGRPPFRVARRFTPRRCLSSRASYPLPRASSAPTSREVHLVSGAVLVGPVHPFGTLSAERSRGLEPSTRIGPYYFRTSTWASYPTSATVASLQYKGHV